MTLADKLEVIKRRLAAVGVFAAAGEAEKRLKDSFIRGLFLLWSLHDWDFKNKTATITTTDGTLGPYSLPTGFIRIARTLKLHYFGYSLDRTQVEPIKDDQDALKRYDLYFNEEDSKLYFFTNPGAASLTLNYVDTIDPDIDNLSTELTDWPEGLWPALEEYIVGDQIKRLPGLKREGEEYIKSAEKECFQYIEKVTSYPKTINPQRPGGGNLDFFANPEFPY